jgi:RNA polymerase sigma-70 factor, ECF subfamily
MSSLSTVLDRPTTKVANTATDEIIALYEKYKRPLHTYIYRLLGSREDADDVIQEVFLTAFVSWHGLTDHSRLSSWLYRVATNLCLDQLRRRKRISWWP